MPPPDAGMPPPGAPMMPPPDAGMPPPGAPMMAPPVMAGPPGSTGDPMIDGMMAYRTLVVKQDLAEGAIEALTGCELENKYHIFDPNSPTPKVPIMDAEESSSFCCRQCCGTRREFSMPIRTMSQQEVVRVERQFHYCSMGCCCGLVKNETCYQTMNIYTGAACVQPNQLLGSTRQEYYSCSPFFTVRDAQGNIIYKLRGGCCVWYNYEVKIFHAADPEDAAPCGFIRKKFSGLQEFFTDADNFSIEFPADANGVTRMLLLGTVFLIDFMLFEDKNQNNNRNGVSVSF